MRLPRPLPLTLVIGIVSAIWGFCGFAWWYLAGGDGIRAAIFLLGPAVIILLLLYLISSEQSLLWNKLVRTTSRGVRQALSVLQLVRWRIRAIVCLVLAILTGFLWARSFWRIDGVDVPVHGTRYVAILLRVGVLTLGWKIDTQRSGQESARWDASEVEPYLQQTRMMQELFADANRNTGRKTVFNPNRAFKLETRSVSYQGRTLGGVSVSFPHWLLLIVFGIIPAVSFVTAFRRYRRGARHRCLECEYDVTGNISGVCPECGSSIGCAVAEIRPPPTNSASETPT